MDDSFASRIDKRVSELHFPQEGIYQYLILLSILLRLAFQIEFIIQSSE